MDLLARQRAVVAAVALAAAVLLPSTPAHADLADGFGVRPVVPPGATTPPAYFDLEADAGQTLRRSVVTSNGSKKAITYRVDAVDGLTGQTSGVVYANRENAVKEAGAWIEVGPKEVTLQPGETRRVPFTIHVPERTRPGDHLAGLAFEDKRTESTESRFTVKQVVRVVMGVQVRVRGGGKPAQIEIGQTKLAALPGSDIASVVLRLGNRGDRLCKPKVDVQLTSASGKVVRSTNELDTILAHDKISYPLPLRGALEAGEYTAAASVSGCGERREATAKAVLVKDLSGEIPKGGTQVVAASAGGGLPIWASILIGLGGSVGGALMILWFQRRRGTAA